MFLLNLILVHLEDAELLDDFSDLELHVHRVLTNLIDDIEKIFDSIDRLNIALQLLFILVSLTDHLSEIPDSNVLKDLTKGVEPELYLLVGTVNNLLIVDENEVVLGLRLFLLDIHTLEHLEADNSVLNILHTCGLFICTRHLGQLLPIIDESEGLVTEAVAVHLELLLDLLRQTNELEGKSGHDGVVINIVEECVADSLLAGILIDSFLEDAAEAVPPATESLGRIDDVAGEAVECLAQVMNRRVVVHLRIVEGGFHLNERFTRLLDEGFVSCKGANDHLIDSVEDLTLPIVVVDDHLVVTLSSRLESLLLDRLQVVVTNVVIVLHKGIDFLDTVRVKVLTELGDIHDLGVLEINWTDDAGILNGLHLLLDVGSLLEDAALGVLELFNLLVALFDVLCD